MNENIRSTIQEIAHLSNIPLAGVHVILHKYLKVRKVNAEWIPRLLSGYQKQGLGDTCKATS